MKLYRTLFCCVVVIGSSIGYGADTIAIAGHRTKSIEGWTLHINEKLFDQDSDATQRALELLTLQLNEITRTVPAASVAKLRKVPLWFSPPYQSSVFGMADRRTFVLMP